MRYTIKLIILALVPTQKNQWERIKHLKRDPITYTNFLMIKMSSQISEGKKLHYTGTYKKDKIQSSLYTKYQQKVPNRLFKCNKYLLFINSNTICYLLIVYKY